MNNIVHAFCRGKRCVGTLMLGVTALIAIAASFVFSTAALVKQIHSAQHVN